jgi:Carboxypeptidase regulatory-like domain
LPQKGTGCVHLLEVGWKETRCTQACPTGALTLVHADDADLECLAKEGFSPYMPDLTSGHRVLFKNLQRWTRFFLAGSVVAEDKDECVENATVTFTVDGRRPAETTTDNYGDFLFEGLEPAPDCRVTISLPGYASHEAVLSLQESLNLGSIFLKKLV